MGQTYNELIRTVTEDYLGGNVKFFAHFES